MPKETIKTKASNFGVQVGWSKDHDVQLGVFEAEDRSLWWVYGGDRKETIGAEVRRIVDESSKEMYGDSYSENQFIGEQVLNLLDTICGAFYELWATMSRDEVNTLIRVLRRARDSAFGKDE